MCRPKESVHLPKPSIAKFHRVQNIMGKKSRDRIQEVSKVQAFFHYLTLKIKNKIWQNLEMDPIQNWSNLYLSVCTVFPPPMAKRVTKWRNRELHYWAWRDDLITIHLCIVVNIFYDFTVSLFTNNYNNANGNWILNYSGNAFIIYNADCTPHVLFLGIIRIIIFIVVVICFYAMDFQ